MNNLCIDAGNTRVKYAIFGGETGELLHLERLADLNREKISALCLTWGVKNAIISTVREEKPNLELLFGEISGTRLILEADTPCPIQNLYASPATLGKDRLAAVVGAAAILPNLDVLVIDAGTCIKYDAIDREARYFGGSISLGLEMRFAALSTDLLRNDIAALLPDYMVPRKFHCMDRLPRNVNDKFDRKAMLKLLEEGL